MKRVSWNVPWVLVCSAVTSLILSSGSTLASGRTEPSVGGSTKRVVGIPDYAALRTNWVRDHLDHLENVPREAALEIWLAREILHSSPFRTPVVIQYFSGADLEPAQKLRDYLVATDSEGLAPGRGTRNGFENRIILVESLPEKKWTGWLVIHSEGVKLPQQPPEELARTFRAMEWNMGVGIAQTPWNRIPSGESPQAPQLDPESYVEDAVFGVRGLDRVFAGLENGRVPARYPKVIEGLDFQGRDLAGDSLRLSQAAVKKNRADGESQKPGDRSLVSANSSPLGLKVEYRTEVLSIDRTALTQEASLDQRASWIGGRVSMDWEGVRKEMFQLGIHGDYGTSFVPITDGAREAQSSSWSGLLYGKFGRVNPQNWMPSFKLSIGRYENDRRSDQFRFLPNFQGWMGQATLSIPIDSQFVIDGFGSYYQTQQLGASLFDIGGVVRQKFFESKGRVLEGRFGFQISAAEALEPSGVTQVQETWSNVFFGFSAEI